MAVKAECHIKKFVR
jgi:hypothetical protein